MKKFFGNITKEITDNAIKKNNEAQIVKVSCLLIDKILQNVLFFNNNKDLDTLWTLINFMKKQNPKKIIFYWNKHVYMLYGNDLLNNSIDFLEDFNIYIEIEKHVAMFPD